MAVTESQKPSMNRRLGFHDFNLNLICSITLLVLSSFNYGISDQAFASTQATNAFAKQFGDFDVESKTYVIPALYLSLLNSLKAGSQLFGKSCYVFPAVDLPACYRQPYFLEHLLTYLIIRCFHWQLDQQSIWPEVVHLLDECLRDR